MLAAYPYFKTWLIFTIVSSLIGAGVGMLAIAVVVGGMEGMGFDTEIPDDKFKVSLVASAATQLVYLPISFIIFRWSVMKFLLEQREHTWSSAEKNIFGGPG